MILLTGIGFSQKKRCGTDELNFNRLQQNPSLIEIRKQQEVELKKSILNSSKKRLKLTIPVVVHVVYNTDLENISDEQINSQIQALNRDFNNLNSDTLTSDHAFYPLVGNLGIKFELATKDPSGKKTTGITRTKTSKINWIEDDLNKDNMKFTSSGGIENWDPKSYLNIYTVRFADAVELLGYAYFPVDLADYPETDGVVIDFRCFGTNGTSGIEGFKPYNLGRTVTHEVGHWLGLYHIWGDRVFETDKECGDDQVKDTPPAEGDNSGNPTFPHRPNNNCGSDKNGEMYMNYMDYVHDKSMVMFSKGQVTRMTSAINTLRKDLFNYVSAVDNDGFISEWIIGVSPNPVNDLIFVSVNSALEGRIRIFDMVGKICFENKFSSQQNEFIVSELKTGNYIVELESRGEVYRTKLIKN